MTVFRSLENRSLENRRAAYFINGSTSTISARSHPTLLRTAPPERTFKKWEHFSSVYDQV
jgi:hypothetical protein